MIKNVNFHVEIWVSPDQVETAEDETRSIGRVLQEEIQSNLEGLRGIFQVHVTRVERKRRT
jgi:hypothetical protein